MPEPETKLDIYDAIRIILESAGDSQLNFEREDDPDGPRYAKEMEDSIALAEPLLNHAPELMKLAKLVVERWDKGDLAGAVRSMAELIDDIEVGD